MLNATATADALWEPCPHCQSPLVTEFDAEPWCERCEWNLDAYCPDPDQGLIGRLIGKMVHYAAYDLSQNLFSRLRGRTVEPPTVGAATLVLVAISAMLMTLTLGLLGIGLWMVVELTFLAKLLAVVLILIAFVLRPRLWRLKDALADSDRLTRQDAPQFFALIDETAAAIGTPTPHVVALSPQWNASAGVVGLRRRRVLTLGLPLWAVLAPQERVALLGHEMGHFVNGDAHRGLATQPALRTFGELAELTHPAGVFEGNLDGFVGLVLQIVVRPIMTVVSYGFLLLHLGANAIGARVSQRAEYYADDLSAHAAGTPAAIGLMDVLTSSDGLMAVIGGRARSKELAADWRASALRSRAQSAQRLPRLRQLTRRQDATLIAAHPAPGLRHDMLAAAPYRVPTVWLSEERSQAIDAELARYEERYRRIIAESW